MSEVALQGKQIINAEKADVPQDEGEDLELGDDLDPKVGHP